MLYVSFSLECPGIAGLAVSSVKGPSSVSRSFSLGVSPGAFSCVVASASAHLNSNFSAFSLSAPVFSAVQGAPVVFYSPAVPVLFSLENDFDFPAPSVAASAAAAFVPAALIDFSLPWSVVPALGLPFCKVDGGWAGPSAFVSLDGPDFGNFSAASPLVLAGSVLDEGFSLSVPFSGPSGFPGLSFSFCWTDLAQFVSLPAPGFSAFLAWPPVPYLAPGLRLDDSFSFDFPAPSAPTVSAFSVPPGFGSFNLPTPAFDFPAPAVSVLVTAVSGRDFSFSGPDFSLFDLAVSVLAVPGASAFFVNESPFESLPIFSFSGLVVPGVVFDFSLPSVLFSPGLSVSFLSGPGGSGAGFELLCPSLILPVPLILLEIVAGVSTQFSISSINPSVFSVVVSSAACYLIGLLDFFVSFKGRVFR